MFVMRFYQQGVKPHKLITSLKALLLTLYSLHGSWIIEKKKKFCNSEIVGK